MEDRLAKLEEDVRTIKERNLRVEGSKAWETSATRVLSLVVITYVIAAVALYAIGNDNPLRNALIPAVGFFLSTQSLPFLRRAWIRHYDKTHE